MLKSSLQKTITFRLHFDKIKMFKSKFLLTFCFAKCTKTRPFVENKMSGPNHEKSICFFINRQDKTKKFFYLPFLFKLNLISILFDNLFIK